MSEPIRTEDPEFATRTQRFFDEIAAEARKVSFSHLARDWTSRLLIRAEEARIYSPHKP